MGLMQPFHRQPFLILPVRLAVNRRTELPAGDLTV
jgi:hypothetical protein